MSFGTRRAAALLSTPAVRSTSIAANVAAATNTATPGSPSGTVSGDLLIAAAQMQTQVATIATPSGWTLLYGPSDTSGTGTNRRSYVWYRTADGTATDAPTFTKTGSSGWSVRVVCISTHGGLDTGHTSSNILAAAADTSPIASTVTPSTTDGLDLILVCKDTGGSTSTAPANYQVYVEGTGASQITVLYRSFAPASATGALTITQSTAVKWGVYHLPIKHA